MVDKNQAVIDFLNTCPAISSNPLFFNFLNAKDDNKQLITQTNDTTINRAFIDGSILKRYTFTLIDFKSVAYEAIPKNTVIPGTTTMTEYTSENVEEMFDVQGLIDWIREQADARTYPDFGDDCQIDDMRTTSENPALNGVDTSVTPALAKYSITIQIDYLDTSKAIWKGEN